MENLFAYLETFQPVSDGLKSYLNDNMVAVSFPGQHILLEVPKIASHLYYLRDGFAMSYTFNREGKIMENFWKPGQFIVAFESFIYQRPSFEVIQLVKPSDLLCMSYETMMEMFSRFPEANSLYRFLMNRHYSGLRKRLRMLREEDHVHRYQKLLEDFPGIERVVTQRSIASYLGVTPQTLSRIKRKHDM